MGIYFETKESFEVLGKEGMGYADKGAEWIPPLWKEANGNFQEIAPLVSYKEDGQAEGIWGTMSDVHLQFKPWDSRGRYLAGAQAVSGVAAPGGWVKWNIPAFRYVVCECSSSEYREVFRYVLTEYMPENNLSLAGAVHEFYPEPGKEDRLCLYFPIERL